MLSFSSTHKASLVLPALISLGCSESPAEPPPMVDSGSWYVSGFRWPHDGHPYESEHFVVYSDGASDQARREVAALGEDLLAELEESFGFQGNDLFVFPPGQDKIDIYAYRDRYQSDWGGWGYYGGLLIYSPDHERWGSFGGTEPTAYAHVLKHELMHVLESLMKGSDNPNLIDVWVTEGIAETVSGGDPRLAITTRARLDSLAAQYPDLNPIAMHQYRYPNIPGVAKYFYYPAFQLAVSYLIDPDGHGGSLEDLKEIFLAARYGHPFSESFESRFGMSLVDYEQRFFELMALYLD